MRIALIGSVSSTWHALRGLMRGGAEIGCVLGLDERHAAGVSDYRSLRDLANESKVPFHSFSKVSEPAFATFLRTHRPDLLMVIGLSQLIPDDVVAIAPQGGVGFHPRRCPWGGGAPVAWTILLEQPAAANLFYLAGDADSGDIILQCAVKFARMTTRRIDRSNQRSARRDDRRAEARRLRSGKLPRSPQAHSRATWYARPRSPRTG